MVMLYFEEEPPSQGKLEVPLSGRLGSVPDYYANYLDPDNDKAKPERGCAILN